MRPALDEKLLVAQPNRPKRVVADSGGAWRALGWLSLVLWLAAVSDWVIAWVPFRLGVPEWEFGTITATFSGLPLVTIGFAGMLASGVARGRRLQTRIVAVLLLLFAVGIAAALGIYLLDVPAALSSVTGVAHQGIVKATIRTGIMGTLFFGAYIAAAIFGLTSAKRTASR